MRRIRYTQCRFRQGAPFVASPQGRRVHRIGGAFFRWGDHDHPALVLRYVCRSGGPGRTARLFAQEPNDLIRCADCFSPKRIGFRSDAHRQVSLAIKRGLLVRQSCEGCGLPPGARGSKREKVLAHHDDYGYPLTVRWLCNSCHADWHRFNEPLYTGLEVLDVSA